MKILNLYAGIGGNRKLWGDDHKITAVEWGEKIAALYKEFFPKDTVIVADAHKFLEEHFAEYDFIWSSPPCQSHSRIRNEAGVGAGQYPPIMPDMNLYSEILFLQQMSKMEIFKGKYVVENVIGYYPPLIPAQKISNHYFWANFLIPPLELKSRGHFTGTKNLEDLKGFQVRGRGLPRNGEIVLRNCVEPILGKHILHYALNPIKLQKELAF